MSKTKTKKTKKERNTKAIVAKVFYVAVAISELGAVLMASIVKGETAGLVAKVIVVPIAMDFFCRVYVITKPFFKTEQ